MTPPPSPPGWTDEDIREMALDRAVRHYAGRHVLPSEVVAAAEHFYTFLRGTPTATGVLAQAAGVRVASDPPA